MAPPFMPVYIVSFIGLIDGKQKIPVAPVTNAENIFHKLDDFEASFSYTRKMSFIA